MIAIACKHRDDRQKIVNGWVARVFGARFLVGHNRTERVVEETIELAQAMDFPRERILELVDKVYAKPKGKVDIEIGQVSMCLLSLAETEKLSADACEVAEIESVLAKPATYFAERLKAKIAAGICTDEAA